MAPTPGSSPTPPTQSLYVRTAREEVAPYIPRWATSALDVGCARGGFGDSLREALGPDARLVGVEAMAESAEEAQRHSELDEVVLGYFPDALPAGERFDLVCFNDVLEHMVDPWTTLRRTADYLTDRGVVLATIPSIQYAPVVWDLLRGDFEYQDTGILDRTHLRFFTKRSMVRLFEDCGFEVTSIDGVNNIVKDRPWTGRGHRRKLRHLLGPAQWMQFVVIARPRPS